MAKAKSWREPFLWFCCPDWRSDVPLRRCSYAARGLWIDMITIMHEAEPYGELRDAGQPLGVADLVQLLGGAPAEIKRLLEELESRNVFSRCEDGAIYSRRMKWDYLKAQKDRENGKKGGNPNLRPKDNPPSNGHDNQGVNPPDKARGRARAPDHFHFQKEEEKKGGGKEVARASVPVARSAGVVRAVAQALAIKPPPFTPSREFQLGALATVRERPRPVEPARTVEEQLAELGATP